MATHKKKQFALTRFKLSTEETKSRYGTFFKGGHFAPLSSELAFWANAGGRCELVDLASGARTDLDQAPGKYVRFVASSKSGDGVVVCDGDGWVRVFPVNLAKRKLGKMARKQLNPDSGAAFSDELVALRSATWVKNKSVYALGLYERATLKLRKTIKATGPIAFGRDVALVPSAKGFAVWRAPFASASLEVRCEPDVTLHSVSDDGAVALGVSGDEAGDEVVLFDLVKGKRLGAVKVAPAKGLKLEKLTDEVRLHPLGADGFVRLSMGRDMNGNIQEVAVEQWTLAGKCVARTDERIVAEKKRLGLAEQAMLTGELVLLNRELFVRL